MKEMWCDYYDEFEAEFEEIHGRKPELEEEFELALKADEGVLDWCQCIKDITDYE